MSDNPDHNDAELVLKLYELRREPELRKARDWWLTKFWPGNADEFIKIAGALGTPENAYIRQVGSYWGMAASFANRGILDMELFQLPAVSGEMFFFFAKVFPFVQEIREKMGDPTLFSEIEKAINSTEWGRERLQFVVLRVATLREKMAGKPA
jgi:hypothetical protein